MRQKQKESSRQARKGDKETAWQVIDNLSRKIVNYSLISVSPKGKFVISVVFLPTQIELIDFRLFVTKHDNLSQRLSPFSQISRIKIYISLSGQMKTREESMNIVVTTASVHQMIQSVSYAIKRLDYIFVLSHGVSKGWGLQCMLVKNQGHLSAATPASKLLGYAPI